MRLFPLLHRHPMPQPVSFHDEFDLPVPVQVTISISSADFAGVKDITLSSHDVLDNWHASWLPAIGDTYVSSRLDERDRSYVGVIEKITHSRFSLFMLTTIWCRQMVD